MNKAFAYVRVSTSDQTTENQIHAIQARFPEAEIHSETADSTKERPVLEKLIPKLEEGDTLIVSGIDRLGRTMVEVRQRIEELMARKVLIVSLREGELNNSPTGLFLISTLAAVAELEKNLIIERTRAARERMKAEGKTFGRPRKIPQEQRDHVIELRITGKSLRDIAKLTGLKKSTIAGIISSGG